MAVKKKTNKELNEELEALTKKVNILEKLLQDIAVKLKKTNENQEIIDEIHLKVSTHDLQLDEIHNTIKNTNSSKEKIKNCSECDLTFKSKSLLRKHTKMEHWTPVVKICEHCDELFVENWELEIHLKTHIEAETYSCDECDKSSVLKWRLEKHRKGHRGKIFCHFYNNMQDCPYEEIGCMYLHEDSKICKYKKKCTTELCQFKHIDEYDETDTDNDTSQNDEAYNEEVVVEAKIFKCVKCKHTFKSKDDLLNHGKTHVAGSRNS